MAGRPQLEMGTYGKIRPRILDDGRVQVRCLYRDYDGRSRPITRIGASQAAAERVLKSAIRDRQRVAGDGHIRSDMRITALADLWMDRINESDKAVNTKQQYRKVVEAYIRPALGQLRVSEATVARCDRALAQLTRERGAAVGKSSRAVLSGMMGLAARHDAIASNPVRDTEPIAGASIPKKGKPRALTPEEATDLTDQLRADDRAVYLDLPDLVDFMLATGARIGEALAAGHADCPDQLPHQSLDLDVGTWEVNATIVRVGGVQRRKLLEAKSSLTDAEAVELAMMRKLPPGMHIQHRTKSDAGWRNLALPPFAVQMLKGRPTSLPRRLRAPHGVVFASPARKTLRDPSNCAGDLREALDRLGYGWVTFHTFRKTVATRMDEAGFTPREIADQLGHSKPSMTQDKYMGRGVASARAASLLDR